MTDLFETAVVTVDDWPRDYEAQFWQLYPRRVSKIAAMKALKKVRDSRKVRWAKIVEAIEAYKVHLAQTDSWRPEPKHPATWLNAGCWDDELESGVEKQRPPSFAEIGYGLRRH